jgi:hypothetical protein
MNERRSEHFPEHNVKVVQTGGYVPLHIEKRQPEEDGDVTLISFISHNENDIEFYRRLTLYRHLNIYCNANKSYQYHCVDLYVKLLSIFLKNILPYYWLSQISCS